MGQPTQGISGAPKAARHQNPRRGQRDQLLHNRVHVRCVDKTRHISSDSRQKGRSVTRRLHRHCRRTPPLWTATRPANSFWARASVWRHSPFTQQPPPHSHTGTTHASKPPRTQRRRSAMLTTPPRPTSRQQRDARPPSMAPKPEQHACSPGWLHATPQTGTPLCTLGVLQTAKNESRRWRTEQVKKGGQRRRAVAGRAR